MADQGFFKKYLFEPGSNYFSQLHDYKS